MLPMVACAISLDSPTMILARKSFYSDLWGSLTLPHCGSLQAVLKSSRIARRCKFKPSHKGISQMVVLRELILHEVLKISITHICIKFILDARFDHKLLWRPFRRRTSATLGGSSSCSHIASLGPFFLEEPPWYIFLDIFLPLKNSEIFSNSK